MYFLGQFVGSEGLVGEAAVGSVVFVDDGPVLEGSDEHPLPHIELPPPEAVALHQQVGVADVLLYDLVLVLLPILELPPYVLTTQAVLLIRLH